MKKLSVFLVILAIVSRMFAQMPPGGGGNFRGPGGEQRNGPPPGNRQHNPEMIDDTPVLEYFPEIQGLTPAQKTKISNLMIAEQKDIRQWERQKHELFREEKNNKGWSEKEMTKHKTKISKIDQKIQQRTVTTNLKVEKVLSPGQYQTFLNKRGEFRFKMQRHFFPGAEGGHREGSMPPPQSGGNGNPPRF
ncbi:MAG: hypothetical protein LBR51_04185 [Bacteroidales bacterium]|jgi:Spy/CpxP family protein refolding chaperone|nr:hypothetical protein [Bacteroidales bacterium]